MTVLTRQERDFARYRSEARECVRCGGAYGSGEYSEHRHSGQHLRFLKLREATEDLAPLGDGLLAADLVAGYLGQPATAMPASEVLERLRSSV